MEELVLRILIALGVFITLAGVITCYAKKKFIEACKKDYVLHITDDD